MKDIYTGKPFFNKGCYMKRKPGLLKFAKSKFRLSHSVETTNPIVESPISNPPMNEQTVTPPQHVWSKIERVLDDQEKMKAAIAASKAASSVANALSANIPFMFAPFGETYLA